MSDYRLSAQARADLQSIFRFSLSQWGEARATRYVDKMLSVARRLARSPGSGRAVPDQPDYRFGTSDSHFIFYREAGAGIEIIRILHQRMDITRHLPPPPPPRTPR